VSRLCRLHGSHCIVNLTMYCQPASSRMSIYAGETEERGSKASKYELSVPYVLLHAKSHKNIFDGDELE
jgi:hypothetical protein